MLKTSNKVETNVYELEIAISGEAFEAAIQKAYLKQRKNIAINGFRKGKAPRAFIERVYGEGIFYEDALEILYPDAVAEAIKAGFSDMGTAQEIAKFAQMFANVGDMDVSTATKGITTMLNAFQIDPLEKFKVSMNGVTKETTGLERAIDVLNFAANTQAIDVAGLTSAFQAGGSVLSTYGMSLEETTALITAANNSIQDPTRVGNGLKSIA